MPVADTLGQPPVAGHVGHQSHLHVELSEPCVVGGEDDVAQHGEVHADADGGTVHGGDHRLARAEEPPALGREPGIDVAEHGEDLTHAVVGPRLLDVVASAEVLSGAREQDGSNVRIGVGARRGTPQAAHRARTRRRCRDAAD